MAGNEGKAAASATADYVIIGAGSAGCVLANRLSADGSARVILLEAGADDRPLKAPGQFASNLMIHVPVGYAKTLKDPKVNWLYETEPDPGTGGRRHVWPRGKILGGSSSINGMLYVRGQTADYDGWRQLGCTGWSADDVLPYFKRSENQELGADESHGVGGPLDVTEPRLKHPVSEAVIAACEGLGLPRRDLNGPEQEGANWFQLTVHNGRRCSAAVAYLHTAMKRPNLKVETRALATRILFEGRRATGVEYLQDGIRKRAFAQREVILAGGAVNSPQLLQLSGIGPADLLRSHGIEVIVDSRGVGENLQDHFIVSNTYRLKQGVLSVNELSRGTRLVGELFRYLRNGTGLLALSAAHVAAFCRSRPDLSSPDIQFHILPATMDPEAFTRQQMKLEHFPGLTLAPCQLRPESRGQIRIQSDDPGRHPKIMPAYLTDRLDQEVVVSSLRWARRIAAQTELSHLIEQELTPGEGAETDAELLQFAREYGSTLYHPVGTCAMGIGPSAVVDPQLRVIGVDALRVVDASIMPRIVSGNTNAPTIMIAEKASDMILASERDSRIAT